MKNTTTANNNPRYCIYTRKSTESEDRQVLSIPAQIDELNAIAAERRLQLVGLPLTEAKTAKCPGRTVFGQLMEDIQDGKVQGILCWKLDRLARNPVDGGALIWALDQGKLKEIITPGRTFVNSGDDKFWMQLEFGMAKKYVDDLSVNVKRGLRKKLSMGWLPCRAPIGYLNDPVGGGIVQDPERFELIRRMWKLLLTGQYSVDRLREIGNNQWGLRTRLGSRRGGQPLGRSNAYVSDPG